MPQFVYFRRSLRSMHLIYALSIVLVGLLMSACGGSSTVGKINTGPVNLTFWTWTPNIQQEVDLFNQSHPDIHVQVINAGQGQPEYTKLKTALKAGSGAPDMVQIEYQLLPTFEITGKLLDLGQYGANSLKSKYVPWVWNQVSQGSKVYAMPQDSGPMGLLYRKDLLDQYHIPVPQTWADFANAAVTYHKANPNGYLVDFPTGDASPFFGLLWQAGSRPFNVSGNTVAIHLDDAAALQVADYWGKLINAKAIQTTPDFTTDWYTGLGNGSYASWITAAWGPVFLAGQAKDSAGKWRAAELPQWTPGSHATGNWGGSSVAVTTQTAHPQEAAEFTEWFSSNRDSALMQVQKQSLFPTLQSVLTDQRVENAPSDFFGGQLVNKLFGQIAQNVDTSFQWSPFQDYVYSKWSDEYGSAISGKISYEQAMHNLQNEVVSYAKAQGFTVVS